MVGSVIKFDSGEIILGLQAMVPDGYDTNITWATKSVDSKFIYVNHVLKIIGKSASIQVVVRDEYFEIDEYIVDRSFFGYNEEHLERYQIDIRNPGSADAVINMITGLSEPHFTCFKFIKKLWLYFTK